MNPMMHSRSKFANHSIVVASLLLMACGTEEAREYQSKQESSLTVCNRAGAAVVLDAYVTGSQEAVQAESTWIHAPQLILEPDACTRLTANALGLDSQNQGEVMLEAFSRNGLRWGEAVCRDRVAGSEYRLTEATAGSCPEGQTLAYGQRVPFALAGNTVDLGVENARPHSALTLRNETDDEIEVALMGRDPVTDLSFSQGWYRVSPRQTSRIVVNVRFVPYEGTLLVYARTRNQDKQWSGAKGTFCVSDEPSFFIVDASSPNCHALEGEIQTQVVPSLSTALKVGDTASLTFTRETAQ